MTTNKDAVTREQIERWAKLAGIRHFTEDGLARLGDFAIFARQDRAPASELQADGVRLDESAAMFALRALVAAGYVTQAKVDEALAIAANAPGVLAVRSGDDAVREVIGYVPNYIIDEWRAGRNIHVHVSRAQTVNHDTAIYAAPAASAGDQEVGS